MIYQSWQELSMHDSNEKYELDIKLRELSKFW